ncbi:MAG: response regulator [candidate division FCPU426 bacterium]
MAEAILIAEDDPQIGELLRTILSNKGYDIHWARDGQETMQLAKTLQPDLILMDVLLPKLNGYEVLHWLQSDPALRTITVILMSGKASPADKVAGLRLGSYDFISKPFDLYELMARVEAALRMRNGSAALQHGNRRVKEWALADPLTGLLTPRHFLERMAEEIERARQHEYPLACALAAVDGQAGLAEQYGPWQADQVLQKLAWLLRRTNRVVDLLGRWQEAEIGMLLVQTDLGGAEHIGRRIIRQVRRTKLVAAAPQQVVTVSLGIVALPQAADSTTDSLLARAAEALRQAQQAGGNQVVVA